MPAADEAVLAYRQLYMLPTRYGWLFAALLLVMLLAAINYGNSLAYALTFWLGAAAVVSMLDTHRNLHRVRVRVHAGEPVFAGDTAGFRLQLLNDARDRRHGVVVLLAGKPVAELDCPGEAHAGAELAVPAATRGRLALPPLRLATRYPLGLLYSWSRPLRLAASCLVYPRPGPPHPLPLAPADGGATRTGRARGDDFAGLREFRAGDSPRHVDWRAAARTGRWLTKQFGDGEPGALWLEWESIEPRDVEARLSRLCRWVLDAAQNDLRYGLRLPGQVIAPARGETHRRRCLEALALFPRVS